MKKIIPVADLPKTFRDAFSLARILHVRFLWIDSLCIIQDDPADWEKEVSKIPQVYANTYLVVAASSSLDDDSGFFTLRHVRLNRENISIECQTLRRLFPESPAMIDYCPGKVPNILLGDLRFVQITKKGKRGYDLGITREWLPLPFVIGHSVNCSTLLQTSH